MRHEWIEHHTSTPQALLFVCYRCDTWVNGFPIPDKEGKAVVTYERQPPYTQLHEVWETRHSSDCDEEVAKRLLEE